MPVMQAAPPNSTPEMSWQDGTSVFHLSSNEVILCVLMTPSMGEGKGGREGEMIAGTTVGTTIPDYTKTSLPQPSLDGAKLSHLGQISKLPASIENIFHTFQILKFRRSQKYSKTPSNLQVKMCLKIVHRKKDLVRLYFLEIMVCTSARYRI